MSFGFLGKVANVVGHDVSVVARGNNNPGGGVFGFLGNTANTVVNSVKSQATQVTHAPAFNFLKLGAADITGNQQARANASVGLKQSFKDIATNLDNPSFVAGAFTEGGSPLESSGVHVPTPAGNLHIKFEEMKALQAAKSPAEVKAVIGDSLPQPIANRLSISIANTKDPHIITNLIHREFNPTPPALPQNTQEVTTPVAQTVEPGQGSGINEAINAHLQTISNANVTGPELQDAIAGLKQTHDIRNTEKLSEEARKVVEKDYVGSLSDVLSADNPTDKQVAMGEHLIVRAQQEGNIGQAVNVAEHLDNKLREHGRAIQAASIISRLTPEGRLLAATRKISRAREASPNASKEGKTSQDIKQQLESSVPQFDRNSVGQAVKDISNDQQKLDLGGIEGPVQAVENTGARLANNVEKAALPEVKKKADVLVQELTKKVKQEYLDPRAVTKKSPLKILQEVFGRTAEADEAYPLAQQILRDKYANAPTMQKALDKFFGSKLDLPAAESTIGRAIQDQLKTRGEKVSNIIYKSLTTQEATVKNVANDLVKEGFDIQSATKLAEEVAKRLNKQVADAKISKLQQLSKEAKPKAQSTYLEKINKLSNLGALTDEDYLHLARAKLNLPHLNEESARNISELSQKIQALPDGEEKYKLIRELHDTVNSNMPTKKGEIFRQIFAAPRSAKASFDISGLGRQGAILGTRFPSEWKEAWKDSGKAFASQKFYDNKVAELNTRPDMPSEYLGLREKSGLAIVGGPDSLHEEAFASTLPEKVPLFGKGIEASDRAYTLGLSSQRDRVFQKIYENYQDIKPMSTWSDKEVESLGRFINTASGRGDLGKFLETHGKTLQEALFSPKLWKSRLDTINPYYYYQLKGPAKKYAAQSAATFAGTAASMMALAVAAGAEVETDPRSSDFLKIKVGDTRFDILGGLQQNLVFLWREASGQKKSSQTGNITDLGSGDYGAATRLSIISDLFQSKENPSVSEIATQIKGQDSSGNKLTPTGRLKQFATLGIPLSVADTYNNVTHSENVTGGLMKSIPGFLGVGVNSYGIKDINVTTDQKKYLDLMKQNNVSEDQITKTKEFFQIGKSISSKQDAYKDIDRALKAGDQAKAYSIAKEYNSRVDAAYKDWIKQNGDKYGNEDLYNSYTSKYIDPDSFQERLDKLNNPKLKL